VEEGVMTRPAWQQGRNYDANNLKLYTANPGFIVGMSLLGVDPLGAGTADAEIPATFTGLTIESPTTVDDGMFVHREVETCSLSATLPDKVDLRNTWIAVTYFGIEVYRGLVGKFQLSESVEVFAEYKPGNTATKTYRVALTATNGEDALAGMSTPARNLTNETLAQRITSWTGLAVTTQAAAADMPVGWANAGWDTAYVRKIYRTTDQLGSLLDTLRDEAKLRNMTFLYQPLAAQPFVLKPNNQWLTGTASSALCFTDDPAHTNGQATDPGDLFVHLGRYVGYTSRTVGEDPSMFRNAAAVQWGQYDVESPPPDGEPIVTKTSTLRASGAASSDVVVDLGTIDLAAGDGSNGYRLWRAATQTLPLRRSSEPFTQQVSMPLQSTQQLTGTVPGMALLEHDGIVERVAVLGRTHQITPDRWLVSYTLGPPHLLDRSSDLDPGTPEVHAATGGPGPGTPTTFEWVVPDYPSDATIYEVVTSINSSLMTVLVTSDNLLLAPSGPFPFVSVAQPPGTVRQIQFFGPPGIPPDTYFVFFTSNPSVGAGNPSPLWREGAPGILGGVI
jgi:hypothetical protein